MHTTTIRAALAALAALATMSVSVTASAANAQDSGKPAGNAPPTREAGPGGGPNAAPQVLVKRFDADGDGALNFAERTEARAVLKKEAAERPANERRPGGRRGGGPGGPGGPSGPGGSYEPARPGHKVSVESVKPVPATVDLYDAATVRTLFIDFPEEGADWEAALSDFYNSDVEVPATLTVDGVSYPKVGVHFRGASSYFTVPAGHKRSLNVSVDANDDTQVLLGYSTLNLLNGHADPSLMSTVLYSTIARQFIPAPRANYVRVVINGENWGIFVNVEQFNGDFVKRHFAEAAAADKTATASKTAAADKTAGKAARWKVPGRPGARSGLEYTGDDVAPYKKLYEIKSADREESWRALVNLCKVLNTTPPEKLEEALKPILAVDEVLKFLALDVVLVNGDGYWTRASDYSLYMDRAGVFHVLPHDMNEGFRTRIMGPSGGGRGPPGAGGPAGGASAVTLDPLVAATDEAKPLRSKLLAVPALRERYLAYVREIAQVQLDWQRLGKTVASNRALLMKFLEEDTRKLSSADEFRKATSDGGSLRQFADQRRAFLLAPPPSAAGDSKKSKDADKPVGDAPKP